MPSTENTENIPQAIAQNEENQNPDTLVVLNGPLGSKLYLVGTAHFSIESQREVSNIIQKVRPNCVVLELCSNRVNILKLDEETVLREAKEMNVNKMLALIKETSVVHGLLQSLMIRLYAKVTQELGLAPGGEFRVAYNEAQRIPGCRVILGDMPINLTLTRGFHSLPWYRKLKLAWLLLTTNDKLTKDDIEKLKRSDILDTLVKEFGDTFPEFKRVLIDERDMFLTNSLRTACQPIPNEFVRGGFVPACVVGVVGLGHVAGIKRNWEKEFDIEAILKSGEKPKVVKPWYSFYVKLSVLLGTLTVLGYQFTKKLPK